ILLFLFLLLSDATSNLAFAKEDTHPMKRDNDYEVVIIGAGIGGLMCGNFLAQRGIKTLICEQYHQPGGCMQGFTREGFYFDACDQSFESAWVIFPLLKKLGILEKVQFEFTDYRLILPDADISINSFDGLISQFKQAFPEEAKGVEDYFTDIRKMTELIEGMFEKDTNPFIEGGWKKIAAVLKFIFNGGIFYVGSLKEYNNIVARQWLEQYFTDPRLLNALSKLGYKDWSAMNFAITWYCWLKDYWYPKGGIQGFSNLLAETFQNRGGTIKYNTMVDKILLKDGRAVGVRTKDGSEIRSRYVVSSCDYKQTLLKLLPSDVITQEDREMLEKAEVSETFVSVYLALNLAQEELRKYTKAHHVWLISSYDPLDFVGMKYDKDFHRKTWIELSSPGSGDKSLVPEEKSALIIQALSSYDWMDKWKTGPNGESTPEYHALADDMANGLIEEVEKRIIPGLRDKIVFKEIATPITKERLTLNIKGATGGWTWHPQKSYAKVGLKKWGGDYRTPVKNLYAASQWALQSGCVPRAALAGKDVADIILTVSK
ncbi:MAG TPA: NAD(P)/FAD-dependent oxidoreductase, partial [Candidatus Brocadiales bacterium]|nr:NAD(P)/FAD-dependent oxidoreductase [Candidatus Brocadiales bacterium]